MPDGLYSYVAKLYGLPLSANITRVQEGYLSSNFIITTGAGKYFLKQYRFDDASKVAQIHQAKFFFSNGGIPIILPVTSLNGQTFVQHNAKFCALFPFVAAQSLRRATMPGGSLKSAANMLARIHLLSKNAYPRQFEARAEAWDKAMFSQTVSAIQKALVQKRRLDDFDKLAAEALALKQNLVNAETKRYEDFGLKHDHLIHGDYHELNLFFDKQGNVSHVFDLEKTKVTNRLFELVRSVDIICFNSSYSDHDYRRAKQYLQAYNAAYPIDKAELEATMRAYSIRRNFSLWIEESHYLHNNHRVDLFLKPEVETIKFNMRHLDEHLRKILAF